MEGDADNTFQGQNPSVCLERERERESVEKIILFSFVVFTTVKYCLLPTRAQSAATLVGFGKM